MLIINQSENFPPFSLLFLIQSDNSIYCSTGYQLFQSGPMACAAAAAARMANALKMFCLKDIFHIAKFPSVGELMNLEESNLLKTCNKNHCEDFCPSKIYSCEDLICSVMLNVRDRQKSICNLFCNVTGIGKNITCRLIGCFVLQFPVIGR